MRYINYRTRASYWEYYQKGTLLINQSLLMRTGNCHGQMDFTISLAIKQFGPRRDGKVVPTMDGCTTGSGCKHLGMWHDHGLSRSFSRKLFKGAVPN